MFSIFIFLILAGLWVAFSGLFKPLLLFFGFLSIILVMYLLKRMNLLDNNKKNISFRLLGMISYFFWLFFEILKSNYNLVLLILKPKSRVNQKLIEVNYSQKSDVGQVIFANSITLTPGTITVELDEKNFQVHVLDFKDKTINNLQEMNERVTDLEKENK